VYLLDSDGSITRARNYVNVDVRDPAQPVPQPTERTQRGYALRFRPGDYSESSWPQPMMGPRGCKFGASGAGHIDFHLRLPDNLDPAR
jgi:hypothetical protein